MRTLAGIVLFSGIVLAQSNPEFGIAEVHARAPDSIPAMRSGFAHGIYELRNATMVDLVRTAWGVETDKVFGGPAWMDADRFDVVATAPAGSAQETLRAMLRALLQDRFQFAAHMDSRDLPVFAMTAGKKLRLKESDAFDESGCQLQPGARPRGAPGEMVGFTCGNMTMAAFADAVPKMRGAAGYLFNYRVVDQTGLKGVWSFSVKWSVRGRGDSLTTLFDAFENQLGLKLELVNEPTPVVVVDKVNRTPTANLPGVTEKLPPPRMEFEVAEIKPAPPKDPVRGASVRIDRGGLVNIHMTLKELIQETWGDWNGAMVVGMPKFADANRFVVVAKAPPTDLASEGAVFNGIDIDSMRAMLRALLVDRFRLAAHTEERLVPGYALVGARPKLRVADSSNRPGCKEGTGPDGKDPRLTNPMASRLVTCRNITIAEFVAELGKFVYRFPPVVDATGIDGRYDITINFSPPSVANPAMQPKGADGVASEPDGTISILEALEKQLGLRLESRKVMATVLVIDHVDELPSEN